MYASWANAYATHAAITATTATMMVRRTPCPLERTLPAATVALLCLMLRCWWRSAKTSADYNKRPLVWRQGVRRALRQGPAALRGESPLKVGLSGFVPAARLLVAIEIAERNSVLAKPRFRLRETLAESLARATHSVLWIYLEPPCK